MKIKLFSFVLLVKHPVLFNGPEIMTAIMKIWRVQILIQNIPKQTKLQIIQRHIYYPCISMVWKGVLVLINKLMLPKPSAIGSVSKFDICLIRDAIGQTAEMLVAMAIFILIKIILVNLFPRNQINSISAQLYN